MCIRWFGLVEVLIANKTVNGSAPTGIEALESRRRGAGEEEAGGAAEVVQVLLVRYVSLALLVFGTLGNGLDAALVGRVCAGSSASVLLRATAAANLMQVWSAPSNAPEFVRSVSGFSLLDFSPVFCKTSKVRSITQLHGTPQ